MDACNTDCKTCNIKCPVSTIDGILTNSKPIPKEDENIMIEKMKTQGCGAPKTAELVDVYNKINSLIDENESLGNRLKSIGASTPLSYGIKTMITACLIAGTIGSIVGCFAIYKVNMIESMAKNANENATSAISKVGQAYSMAERSYNYSRDLRRDFKIKRGDDTVTTR